MFLYIDQKTPFNWDFSSHLGSQLCLMSQSKKFLDTNDIGFSKERELLSVELVADSEPYPGCGTLLHL